SLSSFTTPSTSAPCPLSLHDALPIFFAPGGLGMLRRKIARLTGYLRTHLSQLDARLPKSFCGDYAETFKFIGGRTADLRRGLRRSEEHTSELQSRSDLVCRLLLEKKK